VQRRLAIRRATADVPRFQVHIDHVVHVALVSNRSQELSLRRAISKTRTGQIWAMPISVRYSYVSL
jgi:hypothetical protein